MQLWSGAGLWPWIWGWGVESWAEGRNYGIIIFGPRFFSFYKPEIGGTEATAEAGNFFGPCKCGQGQDSSHGFKVGDLVSALGPFGLNRVQNPRFRVHNPRFGAVFLGHYIILDLCTGRQKKQAKIP